MILHDSIDSPDLAALHRWTRDVLPALNHDVVAGRADPWLLLAGADACCADLPPPGSLSAASARRAVVSLGFVGAALARAYQAADPARKATPANAFDGVVVGASRVPFVAYLAAVGEATGEGHPPRDSYTSLTRWNTPPVRVTWRGQTYATMGSAFGDGFVRSYTGNPGEVAFFELIKRSEGIEHAINDLVDPIVQGLVPVADPDVVRRLRTATVLMGALRRVNLAFLDASDLTPEHFLDVFRQHAVHWTLDDVPPSGAQDAAFVERDLMLGIADPERYIRGVRRNFPAMMPADRAAIEARIGRPPLPEVVLGALGLSTADLARLTAAGACALAEAHPVLAATYLLLRENARFAGVHQALAQRFLFKPQRARMEAGMADQPLVSNHAGTTGMTESVLEWLLRARQQHPLVPFAEASARSIAQAAGLVDLGNGEAAQEVTVVLER